METKNFFLIAMMIVMVNIWPYIEFFINQVLEWKWIQCVKHFIFTVGKRNRMPTGFLANIANFSMNLSIYLSI
jgi:hypothetical protein